MLKKKKILSCVFYVGILLTTRINAEEKCQLRRFAELPVTLVEMTPVVKGFINGEPATFIADAGAYYSLIFKHAEKNHHLSTGIAGHMISGVTDRDVAYKTVVKEFSLIGLLNGSVIKGVQFLVPSTTSFENADGILGQNILGGEDVEYDLANRVIRLIKADHCESVNPTYWAKNTDQYVANVNLQKRTALVPYFIGSAEINGIAVKVLFDTGSVSSIITTAAAERAGVNASAEGVEKARSVGGVGTRKVESWSAPFDLLSIGGEHMRNYRLIVSDIKLSSDADLVLGMDFFLSHRLYFSNRQDMLYFTFNSQE